MRTLRIDRTTDLNYTPKQIKPSFGFIPNERQVKALRFLHEKAPRYVKKWNMKMAKHVGDTPEASAIRDSLITKAISKAEKMMAKESKRKEVENLYPRIFGVINSFKTTIKKVLSNFSKPQILPQSKPLMRTKTVT